MHGPVDLDRLADAPPQPCTICGRPSVGGILKGYMLTLLCDCHLPDVPVPLPGNISAPPGATIATFQPEPERPSFATREEAKLWMSAQIGHNVYQDNDRFAFDGDQEAMKAYDLAVAQGCCGFFDENIVVGGHPARIGCNYGH